MVGKKINEVGNCKFTMAFAFNSAAQKWENTLDKKLSDNDLGTAIAVFSESSCTWASLEKPPIPPMPMGE